MSFSAVTCLTYTGTTSLGGTLNLYSNVDSFTTPFQSSINLSAITGNECPYYISNVPDGTTQVRIFDIITGCYCDIPIQSNNLCTTCNLNFNSYSATTVGRIFAGNLTGSCNPNITDYRIYWYETGDTVNPVFTSGKGTEYQPYSFTHPLTGSSAIFAPAGTYIPVIDKIKLSGLTFSQTGGTGNIPAELGCFTSTTVTVDYFTCDNGDGSSNDPNYEHRVQFSGAAAGVIPQTLFSDFLFTGTTDYFAWKFCGFSVEDRLRLTYFSSAYTTPIVIEDIVIGSNLNASDFSLNKIPKSADTALNTLYIKKVSCLTGLTRNINDTLRLEVIPNSANTQTNWDFYFTCLNSFDQNTCILTNNIYKISASTISMTTGSCNTMSVLFKVSGCSKNTDDFSKYIVNDISGTILNNTNYVDQGIYTNGDFILRGSSTLRYDSPSYSFAAFKNTAAVCATPNPSNTITYSKYVSGGTLGIIDMTFNNINDFNVYYNGYISVSNSSGVGFGLCSGSSGPYSGTPFDPNDVKYYRYYQLSIPSNTGSTNCGDGTIERTFRIHPSTSVTTGTTGLDYTLRFTMPTIINNIMEPCYSANSQTFVNQINIASTGTSNNFTGTTNTGSRYVDPFTYVEAFCTGVTTVSSSTVSGLFDYPLYLNQTIPYTGTTPSTIAPSLSAKTFNFDPSYFTTLNIANNLSFYRKYTYNYDIRLVNPLDVRDFEIYAVYTGGTTNGNLKIYSYTGSTSASTIHEPSYFI